MAELIFQKMLCERGVADLFTVASSATSREEIHGGVGNPIYPPAQKELLRHGITPQKRQAVQLLPSDYDRYDLFIGMDERNVQNMLRIFGRDPQKKIRKLMDCTARGGDVADPWYTDRFDITYRDIEEGCTALLDACLTEYNQ